MRYNRLGATGLCVSELCFDSGLLSGEYGREQHGVEGSRRTAMAFPPVEVARAYDVIDVLRSLAERKRVTVAQLADHVAALELSPEQTSALDRASAPEPIVPYSSFSDEIGRRLFAGVGVTGWR